MVRLTFFGDFVCKDPSDLKLNAQMLQTINQSDLLALNFEAPVKCDAKPIEKSGPSIFQSEDCPAYLEQLGFNVIHLANNHIMDYGAEGVRVTKEAFRKSIVIGAGRRDEAYSVTFIKVKGIKVGLLSLVQKEFGALDDFSKPDDIGTAWLGYHKIPTIIMEARKQCDILILLPHAGIENIDAPLPEWRVRYKTYVDWGADAVIASHPHVPQGWEVYNGKYIFYSLGNFFFFKPGFEHASKASKGLCVSLMIDEEKKITPNIYHTKFSDTEISLYDDTEADNSLCGLLSSNEKYQDYLDKELKRLWQDYKLYTLRGIGGIGHGMSLNAFAHCVYGFLKGGDISLLLNNFQCESHRWAIERILGSKLKI